MPPRKKSVDPVMEAEGLPDIVETPEIEAPVTETPKAKQQRMVKRPGVADILAKNKNIKGEGESYNPPRWRDFEGMSFKGKRMADQVESKVIKNGNFANADLSGADFSGFILQGCIFTNAKLNDTDLRGADLRWSNLKGANIDDAILADYDDKGAVANAADLREVIL